jgi:1,4-dihydroxy-6-naphthoate synthase
MRQLDIGFSSCPNDTFIFYGLIKGGIGSNKFIFRERIEDIETLNRLALKGHLDVVKVSIHATGYLLREYKLLRSGAAVGRGCGPLIVVKEEFDIEDLIGRRIAIPGRLTTAALLLGLFNKDLIKNTIEMPFFRIMESVKKGVVDAGVIIHEGRFTYPLYGLRLIVDLGQWWEEETGLPIPLGGIMVKSTIPKDEMLEIENLIKKSIQFAYSNPPGLKKYIKSYAQELSDDVIDKHIQTYVNDFTLQLGEEGEEAIRRLLLKASEEGLIPIFKEGIFMEAK